MKRMAILFSVALVVLAAIPAGARTWHVPDDAPTIQAGIDSAGVGNNVLVAPGTYFEHDIAMKSGIWVYSEQGPGATTARWRPVSQVRSQRGSSRIIMNKEGLS